MAIRFRTFGTASLCDDSGQELTGLLRQPKRVALLTFLCLASPRGLQRRDVITALLWPDLDQVRARAALRKAVFGLREALGYEAVLSSGDEEVGVDAGRIWCDVWAFEEALDAGRPRDALELYHGDLLEGFHVKDVAPEFGQRLDRERRRLRARAYEGAWSLADAAEEAGDRRQAFEWSKRAAELAPEDEVAVRRLIEQHDRLGDRAGALKIYAGLVSHLRDEYQAEPAPETQSLVEAIKAREQERFPVRLFEGFGAAESTGTDRKTVARRHRSTVLMIALGVVFVTAVLYTIYGAVSSPSRAGGDPSTNRVAVLYFDNLSGDPAVDYLAYGLTEETIIRIGRLDRFTVASRPAVRRFQGLDTEPTEIGRLLGVDYLVSGSIRRAADRFRVTVELIRATDGLQLWGDSYESEETNLLAIEEEIALTVATQIAGELEPQDELLLASRPTDDAIAYRHYLRGQYLMAERNPTSVARAIAEFETAAHLDRQFDEALAAAGYGYALFIDWEWNYEGVSRDSLFALGFDAAERALQADSLSADAWRIRATLQMHANPQIFSGADAAYRKALAIDPKNAAALHGYAVMQARLGNLEAAAEHEHRALASESGRPISLFTLSEVAYRSRDYPQTLSWLDSTLVVEPGFFFAYAFRGLARLRLGDLDGAQEDGATSARFSAGVGVPGVTVMALTELAGGDEPAAARRLDRLEREIAARDGETSQDALWLAMIETALGDHDAALDRLERVRGKSSEFAFWLVLPEFDALRESPRFQRLLEETQPRLDARTR